MKRMNQFHESGGGGRFYQVATDEGDGGGGGEIFAKRLRAPGPAPFLSTEERLNWLQRLQRQQDHEAATTSSYMMQQQQDERNHHHPSSSMIMESSYEGTREQQVATQRQRLAMAIHQQQQTEEALYLAQQQQQQEPVHPSQQQRRTSSSVTDMLMNRYQQQGNSMMGGGAAGTAMNSMLLAQEQQNSMPYNTSNSMVGSRAHAMCHTNVLQQQSNNNSLEDHFGRSSSAFRRGDEYMLEGSNPISSQRPSSDTAALRSALLEARWQQELANRHHPSPSRNHPLMSNAPQSQQFRSQTSEQDVFSNYPMILGANAIGPSREVNGSSGLLDNNYPTSRASGAALNYPMNDCMYLPNMSVTNTTPLIDRSSQGFLNPDAQQRLSSMVYASPKKSLPPPPKATEHNYDPGKVKELSLPSDKGNLSEYQCLLRDQILLFAVTENDIQCSAQGRNKPISLGQVGVLCRHCARIPPGMRPSGAVYFPAKLSGLYQASQNMAINHFSKSCHSIPETTRSQLFKLKERKSTVLGGGKHFWANGARVMGVVEHETCLRFKEDEDHQA